MTTIRNDMRLPMDTPRTGPPAKRIDIGRVLHSILQSQPPTRRGRPPAPCAVCGSRAQRNRKRFTHRKHEYFCPQHDPGDPGDLRPRRRGRPVDGKKRTAAVVELAKIRGEVTAADLVAAGIGLPHRAGSYLWHLTRRLGVLRRVRHGVYALAVTVAHA